MLKNLNKNRSEKNEGSEKDQLILVGTFGSLSGTFCPSAAYIKGSNPEYSYRDEE